MRKTTLILILLVSLTAGCERERPSIKRIESVPSEPTSLAIEERKSVLVEPEGPTIEKKESELPKPESPPIERVDASLAWLLASCLEIDSCLEPVFREYIKENKENVHSLSIVVGLTDMLFFRSDKGRFGISLIFGHLDEQLYIEDNDCDGVPDYVLEMRGGPHNVTKHLPGSDGYYRTQGSYLRAMMVAEGNFIRKDILQELREEKKQKSQLSPRER